MTRRRIFDMGRNMGEPVEITPLSIGPMMDLVNEALMSQSNNYQIQAAAWERMVKEALGLKGGRIDPLTGEDLDQKLPPRHPVWGPMIEEKLNKWVMDQPRWGDSYFNTRGKRTGPLKVLSEWDSERVSRFCEVGCLLLQSRMSERVRKMPIEELKMTPEQVRSLVLDIVKEESLALTEHLVVLALESRIVSKEKMKAKGTDKKRRIIIDEEDEA